MDESGLLERLLDFLEDRRVPFCVIGGAGDERLRRELRSSFQVALHPHSINIEQPGSDLRAQIQTDPRYAAFVPAAVRKDVLGRLMPIARMEDVLSGKIWEATDPERSRSKRQKDLADIDRILESYPRLRRQVPEDVLQRLV